MNRINNNDISVIILAAGEANRLKPLSDYIIKPLIPIAGIPLIIRILNNFIQNRFKKFIILVSKKEELIKNEINNFFKQLKLDLKDIEITYVSQLIPLGMGDAILKTENLIKNHCKEDIPFIVSASDVIFEENIPSILIDAYNSNPKIDFILTYVKSNDPKIANTHGNILIKNEIIKKIIEKPGEKNKISDFYSMPIYLFKQNLFDYIKIISKSIRGEFELQDAIQKMIDDNKIGYAVNILPNDESLQLNQIGKYHITYFKDIILMTSRFLIPGNYKFTNEFPAIIEPVNTIDVVETEESVLIGPNVFIHSNCKIGAFSEITNSILLGNNRIGKNVKIMDSIIGFNVEIPNNCIIENRLILNNKITL